jgi:hypothetical protein
LTKPGITVIIDDIMVTHFSARRTLRRDTALALGVGFFLFAVYLLSYRGSFHSIDEVSMFAVTESMVKFSRLDTDQIAWTQWTTSQREAQGFFGVDGHVYSKKGLVVSLAMAPLYWLGLMLPGLGMLQTASLLNPIVTAIAAALLFRLVRRLGYAERVAIGVALLYGLAVITWVYSKYLFSEPLAGLLLLATAYLLITFRQEAGNWRAMLAGVLTGLAVATRANNLFLVPVFGIYLVVISRQQTTSRLASPAPPGHSLLLPKGDLQVTPYSSPKGTYRLLPTPYFLLPTSYFLLGLIPPALMLMGYNWVRVGNPFQTGYDLTIFSPNLLLGLYRLLFSPLRGLFVYSPLLLLSVPGLAWLWRRCRAEAGLVIGVTGVTIFLFSAWTSGEGLSWGSRFLVPVVPFLCLALAPILDRALAGSKVLAGSLLSLGTLSFAIQFLGVAINPWIYLAQLQADFGGEFFLENTPALTDFRYMQVIGQLQSWSLANSDVAWWQPWGFDGLSLGTMVVLLGLSGVWLWRLLRYPKGTAQLDTSRLSALAPFLLMLFAVFTSLFILERAYRTDRQFGPPEDAYTHALNTAAAQSGPSDHILTVAQSHYHVSMNRFKARVPIIGFAQQQPPLPETALPLLRDSLTGQNAWLVTVGFQPAAPDNAAEHWLTFNAYKASDEWWDNVRLVRYGLSRPMTSRTVNATLGEELRLVGIELAESARPGQILPVEFVWLPLRKPVDDYNLFLQLLAADGALVAQHDGSPNGGYTPTSGWSPGEKVSDRHGLALPVDLPAGEYRLIAGLYHPVTGERLSTLSPSGRDFVDLGTVTIR